jgi:hypothetical protein
MLRTIAERDDRLLAHCREGLELARRIPEYRHVVLARLAPDLAVLPDDLWTAVPWIWAVALDAAPPAYGARAEDVTSVGSAFARSLSEGASLEDVRGIFRSACGSRCDPGVVMRSHPFPDLRAWSLRTMLGV